MGAGQYAEELVPDAVAGPDLSDGGQAMSARCPGLRRAGLLLAALAMSGCATRPLPSFPLHPRGDLSPVDPKGLAAASGAGRVLLAVDDRLVFELDPRCVSPRLPGSGGDGRLHGQDGDGRLHGQDGAGRLHGDAGDGRLHGQGGDDRLHGNAGDGRLHGQEGDGRLHGGAGDGRLHGQDGDGRLHGSANDNRRHGQDADGRLHGDAGRPPGCRLDAARGVVSFVNLESRNLRIFVDRMEYRVNRNTHPY